MGVAGMDNAQLGCVLGLVVQSSLLAITVRYSRVQDVNGARYLTSTAVASSELLKVIILLLILTLTARKTLYGQLVTLANARDVIKCCVPAILYTIQNNLLFVAMSYLDAATFQVTAELKILTSAILSVCLSRHELDVRHWSAILLLAGGVVMVQLPSSFICNSTYEGTCSLSQTNVRHVLVGVASVLVMCITSCVAGLYTDKLLKSTTTSASIWTKNLQLALCSLLTSMLFVYLCDGHAVTSSGFYQGYNSVTWGVVVQQAVLGLLVSHVIRHTDNLLKSLASFIAIVITTFISSFIFNDLHLSCSFLIGSLVVLGAALFYNVDKTTDSHSVEPLL